MGVSAGKGAEAHDEGGVKTGRQANPAYKRPQPDEPSSQEAESPTSSAGFAGEIRLFLPSPGCGQLLSGCLIGYLGMARRQSQVSLLSEKGLPAMQPMTDAHVIGGGAEAHNEGGIKTGREANPAYKRPKPDQPDSSEPPAPTAGFAGGQNSDVAPGISAVNCMV